MVYEPEAGSLSSAIQDFRHARSQGEMRELLARLTGSSQQLLSYDEVRQKLRLQGGVERGLKDIPLGAIVGSVGRYIDFTRDFLPRGEVSPERWARVKMAASGLIGLPPIDVYQIGEVYFVLDGNHRVSVAREMGATQIQAYVTEVTTRVPLTPDIQPDDLILKAEYILFLEQTDLDRLRPQANLEVTVPGRYETLLEHIEMHRYYMGLDLQRDIPYPEAVGHWYDSVYQPVVEAIHNQGILRHFPGRTETDLYLWISQHRAQLEEQYELAVRPEYAASHLAGSASSGFFSRLVSLIIPDRLEDGPPPGQWRQALAARQPDRLLLDVLVPLNGREDGWCALEQAFVLARREGSALHGLHVVSSEAELNGPAVEAVQAEFQRRCQQAGVQARLSVAAGDVVTTTCERARLTDLIAINLSYPPPPQMLARLSSGFRDLIHRSPRPILATPQTVTNLERALLAFDGSPKGQEALFLAAYLAGRWQIPLFVVSAGENETTARQTLEQAENYLNQRQVPATCLVESGPPAEAILKTSAQYNCDLIVTGSYGLSPVFEVMLGSTLDQLLRSSRVPLLICR